MTRNRTTVYVEEDLLRSKVLVARADRKEYEIFEEALKSYPGLDVLENVWRREELPDEKKATGLAYEGLHPMRAEEQRQQRRKRRREAGSSGEPSEASAG